MSIQKQPWYEGKNQDALFYLLTAIFLLELAIGGIAFFYGIIHAAPEFPGGPPVAQFPWLAWLIAALLGPVALVLGIHLAGSWLSGAISHDQSQDGAPDADRVPEALRRFYAIIRHAPTILILVAILVLGALLYFVDGAFAALINLGQALLPYLPWLSVSIAALLAFCFLVYCLMAYKQRKMEREYAWRREVLEKTGLVITDNSSRALPVSSRQMDSLPGAPESALPPGEVLDAKIVEPDNQHNSDNKK